MSRYSHTGQCVRDLVASRRFYVDALGFEEVLDFEVSGAEGATLLQVPEPLELRAVYLRRDGFVLELLAFSRPEPAQPRSRTVLEPGLTHISVMVDDDLDAACGRVEAHGGRVLEGSRVGGAVFVEDPEGQMIELLAPGSRLVTMLHGDPGDASPRT